MRVIPKIQEIKEKEGFFIVKNIKNIYLDKEFDLSKKYILSIYNILNKEIKISDKNKAEVIYSFNNNLKDEQYKIKVKKDKILIEAKTINGAVYATQTIRLLSEFDLDKKDIKIQEINDYPEYKMRSLMLDESRYFSGKEVVKNLLDMMSFMKLNTFHWHLTDNEGWRIEIKKYPKLTEIGSKRKNSQIDGYKVLNFSNKPHEGFYTQEEIKEIVKYAKERAIDIIPEIDMPGHFAAASASYPYLTCRELEREVPFYFAGYYPTKNNMPDWDRPLCIANEKAIEFAKDVIDEVVELFPFGYFHIGGDEVTVSEWKVCPKCQELMRKNNLKTERALQTYFTHMIKDYIKTKNKRLIGWNEILWGDDVDKTVVPQYWTFKTDKRVNKFLEEGGEVLISKHNYFYFDMPYSLNPLNKTYSFELSKLNIDEKYKDQIKGFEGALWTEWIPDKYKFDFMLYPRMQALSEISWNNKEKNKNEFLDSLDEFTKILDKFNIGYAKRSVTCPKNLIKRQITTSKWHKGNKNIEQDKNI